MNIRDRAKDVAQAAHEIKSLELSQRIANLHSDIVALVEENLRLNDENKELKETLRLKREMKYKEPFYFLDGDETPFCPACWESKSQLVHLSCLGEGPLTLRWTCPSCKHLYLVRKVRPVVPASRSYGGRVLKVEWDRRKTAYVDFHLVAHALNVHLKINYPPGVNRRRTIPAIPSTPTPKRAKLEGCGTGVLTKLVSVKAVPYWKTTELPSSLSEISVPFLAPQCKC